MAPRDYSSAPGFNGDQFDNEIAREIAFNELRANAPLSAAYDTIRSRSKAPVPWQQLVGIAAIWVLIVLSLVAWVFVVADAELRFLSGACPAIVVHYVLVGGLLHSHSSPSILPRHRLNTGCLPETSEGWVDLQHRSAGCCCASRSGSPGTTAGGTRASPAGTTTSSPTATPTRRSSARTPTKPPSSATPAAAAAGPRSTGTPTWSGRPTAAAAARTGAVAGSKALSWDILSPRVASETVPDLRPGPHRLVCCWRWLPAVLLALVGLGAVWNALVAVGWAWLLQVCAHI